MMKYSKPVQIMVTGNARDAEDSGEDDAGIYQVVSSANLVDARLNKIIYIIEGPSAIRSQVQNCDFLFF